LRAWRTQAEVVDVGTPTDYLQAALRISADTRPLGSAITRTVVWPGSHVDPAAVLDRCIVAGPIHVPAGFEARDAILMPSALFAEGESHVRVEGALAVVPMTPEASG
jgi:hypothetical protein